MGVEFEDSSCAGLSAGLLAEGVAVQDRFVPQARIHALIDCAQRRLGRGDFGAARIGSDHRLQRRAEIRGDHICWLDEPLFAEERALLSDLEQLRLELNARAFLGLFDLELHYAWYPPGAGYAPHVDQPMGREQRRVSLVLYLNHAWQPDDGGELRIFGPEGERDIEPIAGRLVCFLTAGRKHAVLPTRQTRLSITGWFRRREATQ
ncbi:MAG: 2OG-Fe(II) oxygenase [Pseudomonadota bacterium]|nr:2OG-Fe(II) oxygenase [Pseudomonadota bacterium]